MINAFKEKLKNVDAGLLDRAMEATSILSKYDLNAATIEMAKEVRASMAKNLIIFRDEVARADAAGEEPRNEYYALLENVINQRALLDRLNKELDAEALDELI